uniref:Frizzled-4 n=1 Tax=Trichobilharzia regenti TaxID=157069 RepID=A0AA85IXK4_TRIRE|nr:unnamed protein product [Trichobilharzia regenti]
MMKIISEETIKLIVINVLIVVQQLIKNSQGIIQIQKSLSKNSDLYFHARDKGLLSFPNNNLPQYVITRKLRNAAPSIFPSRQKDGEVSEHLKSFIESSQDGHVLNEVYSNRGDDAQQQEIEEGVDDVNHCVPIHEPICHGLQYTHTWLPNSVGLTTQEEAAKRMNDYRSLINVGCSQYLKFFLCTIYFPMCTPALNPPAALQPCQNLCRYVQSKCEPIMKSFSFPWPIELNCKSLPSDSGMCIQPQNYDLDKNGQIISQGIPSEAHGAIAELLPDFSEFLAHQSAQNQHLSGQNNQTNNNHQNSPSLQDNQSELKNYHLLQKTRLHASKCSIVEVPLYSEQAHNNITCARRCNVHLFYRPIEKRFANVWMIVWAILCMGSCTLTIVTFILNRTRFTYPERPIIYISACYFFYSAGFILHALIGRDMVACRNKVETISQSLLSSGASNDGTKKILRNIAHSKNNVSFLITSGHEGTWCTIVFLILYYFSQASYIWWVMLAIAWFLSASCKWGCEGIEAVSSILHMLAWALPALKTIIILIMHRIDADELTGLCFVGYQNPTSLLTFILLPQIIYLLLGILFLFIGFYSLISVRSNLRQHSKYLNNPSTATATIKSNCCNSQFKGNPVVTTSTSAAPTTVINTSSPVIAFNNGNIRRLDKLMIKICIFSMLYIIPTVCVIGVNMYNYINYPKWIKTLDQLDKQGNCLTEFGTTWSLINQCLGDKQFPSVEANMLQIFMSLVVGMTSGMWVWCNRKSSETWLNCMRGKRKELSQNNFNFHHHKCGGALSGAGFVDNPNNNNNNNHLSKIDRKIQPINAADCCNSRNRCAMNSQCTGNTMNFESLQSNSGQVMGDSSHYCHQHHHHQHHGLVSTTLRNIMPSGSFGLSSGSGSCTSAVPISYGGIGTMDISLVNSNKSNYCMRSSQRQAIKTRPTNIGRPDI